MMQFNCFSLNSIGPMVEMLSGPRRYLAVYFSSALAGSLMSYRFSASPAVGASGAIFGLVGAYAVYMWRHRRFFGNSRESLEHIGRVVVLNMVLLHFFLLILFCLRFKNFLCSMCNIFFFHRVWASFQGELITGAIWEACLGELPWHGS
uniref:Peptidase S54 rhomboid domain-containing protein n=1 Tax=Zea mays TaxID=4577 RepID=B4F9Z2_MAIZE|nr:unknown [Zea mays]|eukprot:NP_001130636.1 uncharacterized protein LOC100191736 [Zea mays]